MVFAFQIVVPVFFMVTLTVYVRPLLRRRDVLPFIWRAVGGSCHAAAHGYQCQERNNRQGN